MVFPLKQIDFITKHLAKLSLTCILNLFLNSLVRFKKTNLSVHLLSNEVLIISAFVCLLNQSKWQISERPFA
ncbi:MAG: hypothetical protein ACTS5P_01660 [Candidatus Hodgkinia cicadicola]